MPTIKFESPVALGAAVEFLSGGEWLRGRVVAVSLGENGMPIGGKMSLGVWLLIEDIATLEQCEFEAISPAWRLAPTLSETVDY